MACFYYKKYEFFFFEYLIILEITCLTEYTLSSPTLNISKFEFCFFIEK